MTENTENENVQPTLNTADAELIAQAFERVRPLDQYAKDTLKELVANDVATIENRLHQAAQEEIQRITDEINESYDGTERVERLIKEARKAVRAYVKARNELVKRANDQDIQLDMPFVGRFEDDYDDEEEEDYDEERLDTSVTAYDQGLRRRIVEATAPVHTALHKALQELQTVRREAERRILLGAISKDAESVLAELPSAEDYLSRALSPAAIEAAKSETDPGEPQYGAPYNPYLRPGRYR